MFPALQKTTNIATTIAINPKTLWIIFGIILSLAVIMSIVLFYHWGSYGYKPIKTGLMGTLYLAGLVVLFGVMFFAIISYTISL